MENLVLYVSIAAGLVMAVLAIFWVTSPTAAYLPALGSDDEPREKNQEPTKRLERGVISRGVVGVAVVELTEECGITSGLIPKVRRRRVIELRGFVTTEADALSLADTLRNYAREL